MKSILYLLQSCEMLCHTKDSSARANGKTFKCMHGQSQSFFKESVRLPHICIVPNYSILEGIL